jgi:hypothetical protein
MRKRRAMRFEVFKNTLKWIESQPPSLRDKLRPLNCFTDIKYEEFHAISIRFFFLILKQALERA